MVGEQQFFVTDIIQQHKSFKWYFQDDDEEAFNLNINI